MLKKSPFIKDYNLNVNGIQDIYGSILRLPDYRHEIEKNRWKLAEKLCKKHPEILPQDIADCIEAYFNFIYAAEKPIKQFLREPFDIEHRERGDWLLISYLSTDVHRTRFELPFKLPKNKTLLAKFLQTFVHGRKTEKKKLSDLVFFQAEYAKFLEGEKKND